MVATFYSQLVRFMVRVVRFMDRHLYSKLGWCGFQDLGMFV